MEQHSKWGFSADDSAEFLSTAKIFLHCRNFFRKFVREIPTAFCALRNGVCSTVLLEALMDVRTVGLELLTAEQMQTVIGGGGGWSIIWEDPFDPRANDPTPPPPPGND